MRLFCVMVGVMQSEVKQGVFSRTTDLWEKPGQKIRQSVAMLETRVQSLGAMRAEAPPREAGRVVRRETDAAVVRRQRGVQDHAPECRRLAGTGQAGRVFAVLCCLTFLWTSYAWSEAKTSVYRWDKPSTFLFQNASKPEGTRPADGEPGEVSKPAPAQNAMGGPSAPEAKEEAPTWKFEVFGQTMSLGAESFAVYEALDRVEGLAEMKPARCLGAGNETLDRLRALHRSDPQFAQERFESFAAERTLLYDPFPCGRLDAKGRAYLTVVRERRFGRCLSTARAVFAFRNGRLTAAEVADRRGPLSAPECAAQSERLRSDLEAELVGRYGLPEYDADSNEVRSRYWLVPKTRIWLIDKRDKSGELTTRAWENAP